MCEADSQFRELLQHSAEDHASNRNRRLCWHSFIQHAPTHAISLCALRNFRRLTRVITIHQRYRQTDGRTDGQTDRKLIMAIPRYATLRAVIMFAMYSLNVYIAYIRYINIDLSLNSGCGYLLKQFIFMNKLCFGKLIYRRATVDSICPFFCQTACPKDERI